MVGASQLRCCNLIQLHTHGVAHNGTVKWGESCIGQFGGRTVALSSYPLAVVTASRRCTDDLKVVSMSLTQGIRYYCLTLRHEICENTCLSTGRRDYFIETFRVLSVTARAFIVARQ